MRSLYKQNLLKSGWVMVNSDEVRVIDSNKAIEEKLVFAHPSEPEPTAYHPVSFDGDEDAAYGEGGDVDLLFEEGLAAETVQTSSPEIVQQQLREAQMQADEMLQQARMQADEIRQQAQAMGEQDARAAYEDAKRRGEQDGYREGLARANAEAEAVRREYEAKEQELMRSYNEKLEEMEPYLIGQLTGIYEHVFDVELSGHRNVLQHLIASTLRSVEMSENYLIHVSEQDYSFVSMQKAQIMEEGCLKNVNLEVVEDRTLGKNECLIETEDGIFDCSLSTQLTELKRKLQLLSYSGVKE